MTNKQLDENHSRRSRTLKAKTKQCGDCKFHLKRGVCPRAEYRKHEDNLVACLSSDRACELFQSKIRLDSTEPEMGDALKLLHEAIEEKYVYKCPSDTKEVLVFRNGVYESAESLIHSILESRYGDVLKRHFVDEAYADLQRANYVDRSEINRFTNKIPLQNGLFNFNTREVEAFDSEQVYTYKLNVCYDPEAKCPKWMEFVRQIVAEADIVLLQEMLGYCLLPAMPFHKIFWWYGKGRNGKGRVVATLKYILGQQNCCNLNLSEFKESRRFSLCQLYGKLLNVSSEPQLSKYGLQTNVLKLVSGEDTIYAELKGSDNRLQFRNVAKMVILGNRFPKVEDNSLGWWDRIVVLFFPYEFLGDANIPNIERRWLDSPEEVSGIFNFMLQGLYRLKENNGFSISKSAQDTKIEFMRVSEPFNAWLNDCTVFQDSYLTRQEAYDSYRDYADELVAEPNSSKTFYAKMRQTPRIKESKMRIKEKTERVFRGITLKNSKEEDESQTKLNIEAHEAPKALLGTQQNNNNDDKLKNSKEVISAISATSATLDVVDYFIECQFPACFSCRLAISRLSDLTNIDGKPIHVCCKAMIEAQKKGKKELL